MANLEVEIRAARRERDWARELHRRAQVYIMELEGRLALLTERVKQSEAELDKTRRRLPWY